MKNNMSNKNSVFKSSHMLMGLIICILILSGCGKENENSFNKNAAPKHANILDTVEINDIEFANTTLIKKKDKVEIAVFIKNKTEEIKNIKIITAKFFGNEDDVYEVNIYVGTKLGVNEGKIVNGSSTIVFDDIQRVEYRVEFYN